VIRFSFLGLSKAAKTWAPQSARGVWTSAALLRSRACQPRRQVRVEGPPDRDRRFSTWLFGRYQRYKQALVATLAEIYVQSVSTREVKTFTGKLRGHAFFASSISPIKKRWIKANRRLARR
jgi:transposase-like protein